MKYFDMYYYFVFHICIRMVFRCWTKDLCLTEHFDEREQALQTGGEARRDFGSLPKAETLAAT